MVTKLLRAATAAAVVAFAAVFAYAWANAPEVVPAHVDGRVPDAWGSRNVMWWTLITTGLAACTTFALSFFPRFYTFPWELTDENRERQHRLAAATVAFVSLCVVISGLLITLAQVSEHPSGLILGLTWVAGAMVAGVTVFLAAAWRAR